MIAKCSGIREDFVFIGPAPSSCSKLMKLEMRQVEGGVSPSRPHRSGRAELQHPVPPE